MLLTFIVGIQGGPGSLQTTFELKNALPTATNQPDATALTQNAINWLERSKKHQKNRPFRKQSKNLKMANLGGYSSSLLVRHARGSRPYYVDLVSMLVYEALPQRPAA